MKVKIGVALSGGGIRGIAHAGVLQALDDNKIKIDIIGGTSAGSMIASLYAMGYEPNKIYELFKNNAKKVIGTNTSPIIYGIKSLFKQDSSGINGFKNGKSIEELYDVLSKQAGIEKIEQIKMPIVIPSVDIMDSKEYIFTNIVPNNEEDKSRYITDVSVGKAVRASSSFPAVFNVCNIEKHAFMDGGMLDNVPVSEIKKQGADKIIAVKFDADPIDEKSNIMDILMKTIDIMGNKISENDLKKSDYILNVCTDKVGLLDINKLDKCYEYGYKAVTDNLKEIKKVLE